MDLIWDKVLKNKPIKICGRQPFFLFQPNFFKGRQILLG